MKIAAPLKPSHAGLSTASTIPGYSAMKIAAPLKLDTCGIAILGNTGYSAMKIAAPLKRA